MNNFKKEEEITSFKNELEDRFGEIPNTVYQLFDALRLRWLGKEIGFTRIILKSEKMKAYFTEDKTSPYFESPQFSKVLDYLKKNFHTTQMKEKNGKLSFVVKEISELHKATNLCKKISLNESPQQDLTVMPKRQE